MLLRMLVVMGVAACGGSNTSPDATVAVDTATVDTVAVDMVVADAALPPFAQHAYVKASNTDESDNFGFATAISADGTTLVVGARYECSAATGIDGNQADNSANTSGAAYVFVRSGGTWIQQAYLKASNTGGGPLGDRFGIGVAVSANGETIAIGAAGEASNATGIDGNQLDNSKFQSGAVYVFTRSGTTWSQQAYVKESDTTAGDFFGQFVALSSDGNTLAVESPARGFAYLFTRTGTTWSESQILPGRRVALSGDGNTLAVSSDSGTPDFIPGARVFVHAGAWVEQAFVQDTEATTYALAVPMLASDGNTLVVSASDSSGRGAAFVFVRSGTTWSEQTKLLASNADDQDLFGAGTAIAPDGNTIAIGAVGEASAASGVDGDQADNTRPYSGAVYAFHRTGTAWTQTAYLKASNTDSNDQFGFPVAVAGTGTVVIGAVGESSAAVGIAGAQSDNTSPSSGAVYVFEAN